MRKVPVVLHVLARLWLCSRFASRAHGFQRGAAPSPPPARRRRRGRGPSPAALPPPRAAVPRLRAFGAGAGGPAAAPPPLRTRADVARRLGGVAAGAARRCASGFANGYLLALAWDLVRGPARAVEGRAVAWGLDFAVLPTVFSGTRDLAALALALPGGAGGGAGGEGAARRGRRVALWSVALRNAALGAYFGRQRGWAQVARSSALAGALTYYFVRKKLVRDAANPHRPSPAALAQLFARAMAANGNGNGTGAPMPGGGPPSPEALAQVLAAMAAGGGAPPSAAGGPRPRVPGGAAAARRRPAPNAPASPSPRAGGEGGSLRDGALDVEFERIDDDDGDGEGERA